MGSAESPGQAEDAAPPDLRLWRCAPGADKGEARDPEGVDRARRLGTLRGAGLAEGSLKGFKQENDAKAAAYAALRQNDRGQNQP